MDEKESLSHTSRSANTIWCSSRSAAEGRATAAALGGSVSWACGAKYAAFSDLHVHLQLCVFRAPH